jgi:hypothetical protein
VEYISQRVSKWYSDVHVITLTRTQPSLLTWDLWIVCCRLVKPYLGGWIYTSNCGNLNHEENCWKPPWGKSIRTFTYVFFMYSSRHVLKEKEDFYSSRAKKDKLYRAHRTVKKRGFKRFLNTIRKCVQIVVLFYKINNVIVDSLS